MVHKTSGAQKHLALLETALRLAHPWRYAENMAAGLERYWSGNEKVGKIVREMYELAGQVGAKIWAMGHSQSDAVHCYHHRSGLHRRCDFFGEGSQSKQLFGVIYASGGPWTVLAFYYFYFCTAYYVDYLAVFLFVFLLFSG